MTTPTPPDAARSYSDDEIDEELARLVTHRHFGVPRDIIEELPAHSPIILAIIRQLRAERDFAAGELERAAQKHIDNLRQIAELTAERDAARAEVETANVELAKLNEFLEVHRQFLRSIHMWDDETDTFNRPSNADDPTGETPADIEERDEHNYMASGGREGGE